MLFVECNGDAKRKRGLFHPCLYRLLLAQSERKLSTTCWAMCLTTRSPGFNLSELPEVFTVETPVSYGVGLRKCGDDPEDFGIPPEVCGDLVKFITDVKVNVPASRYDSCRCKWR